MAGEGDQRNHVSANVAGQSFAISTSQLIPVLILCAAIVAGFLVYRGQDGRLVALHDDHQRLLAEIHTQTAKQREATLLLYRALSVLDFNEGRPHEDKLPLVLTPEWDAHKERPQR